MKIITLTEQAHDTLCEALETLQERTFNDGFRRRLRELEKQVIEPKPVITQCPEGVTIEIQDHDNERHQ